MSANIQFKSYNTGISTIFPIELEEKIPVSSPVRLINSIVDGLKLDKVIERRDRKEGASKEEQREAARRIRELEKAREKLAEYEDRQEMLGDRNSYSKTDTDATFMHMKEDDYYVCPMGQHMEHVGRYNATNDNGYTSTIDRYRAANCEGCPLRGQCFSARGNRTIAVNHKLNAYKRKARERLLSDEGLRHRSRRPIEPEAVFGQIKYDKQYRRFRHRGLDKVRMDFAMLAMAFNLQKLFKNMAKAA